MGGGELVLDCPLRFLALLSIFDAVVRLWGLGMAAGHGGW